ncbi:2-isopropylmalate synthase/homocitrate synthase family protein [Thermodesulfobium narugense DSM 14796]|uniref:Citramalate synthase n=1 Tax=Thermodesulfobium narugense DSM 14796 TaxID=747365 RepID=M1E9J1_9BACT|nr:citramalate synthase [Thermodesulfobium narugense]AEE15369.1 2-isopropylmalate synthase/homocitrate synthase family protein [Thermodesulfobium narugense DSM 14796]
MKKAQRKIELYDTTLRDGAQREGISLTLEDKLKIVKRLDDFGIDYIEAGWPGSNPKDEKFFEQAKDLKLNFAKLVAFGSTRRANTPAENDKNVISLLNANTSTITIFGKSWDLHVKEALKTTLDENLNMVSDTISYLNSKGKSVFFDAEHFFDGFKNNKEYALAVLKRAKDAKAKRIVLADTNGGTLPDEVREIIREVKSYLGKNVALGIHCHNDSELAVANSIAAVQEGVLQVQGTINGFGERAGNANLCSLIPILQLKMNIPLFDEEKLKALTPLSRFIDEIANITPNDHQPFVGKSVFAHKGGIHVSAVLANPKTYEHIDPELIGNKRRVVISELSGTSNIIFKAKEMGIDLSKNRPETRKILSIIKELENQGYQFEAAEASFEILLWKGLCTRDELFDLIYWKTTVEYNERLKEIYAEAVIKLIVEGKISHSVGDGNGPVNAMDKALRSALSNHFPSLEKIHLSDYRVRVLGGSSGTGAGVRVLIDHTDSEETWTTLGVSSNIIEASYIALVDGIEYGLRKERIRKDLKEISKKLQ